jgi:hypothetical protein
MPTAPNSPPEQLHLLDPADGVPLQLRLDERTRRIGLAGVAMVRALLDEQRRRAASQPEARRRPRRRPPGTGHPTASKAA